MALVAGVQGRLARTATTRVTSFISTPDACVYDAGMNDAYIHDP